MLARWFNDKKSVQQNFPLCSFICIIICYVNVLFYVMFNICPLVYKTVLRKIYTIRITKDIGKSLQLYFSDIMRRESPPISGEPEVVVGTNKMKKISVTNNRNGWAEAEVEEQVAWCGKLQAKGEAPQIMEAMHIKIKSRVNTTQSEV